MDKAEKLKIIVVFTDIRGSSRWTRRMGDDEAGMHAFMMTHEREAQFFRSRTGATFYKRLGDGRMFTYPSDVEERSSFVGMILIESLGLIKRVDRQIGRLPSPRPTGFRIRMMAGTVLEATYGDGQRDWIGYVPNTCHKFLSIEPDVPLVIHESVKELIRPKFAKDQGLSFSLLGSQGRCPDGVDREDVDALWQVTRRR